MAKVTKRNKPDSPTVLAINPYEEMWLPYDPETNLMPPLSAKDWAPGSKFLNIQVVGILLQGLTVKMEPAGKLQ